MLYTDNFDEYWRIASRVTPTTTPLRPTSPAPQSVSLHSRPPSADTSGTPDKDGAYNVRSVPVRMYLPDGPVLQDIAPPMADTGELYLPIKSSNHSDLISLQGVYNTLGKFLTSHLPLLFATQKPLAYPLIQGVICPLDAELAWLGACMAGADGWVNIMIGIL